jgi:hypothetical protein
MKIAVTATFKAVGLLFVELNMIQIWAAGRAGQSTTQWKMTNDEGMTKSE